MTTLKRYHRTFVGTGLVQGSCPETRGRSIILTASRRSWRIETIKTLGYGKQGEHQVQMQGMVAVQLTRKWWRAGVGEGLRKHGKGPEAGTEHRIHGMHWEQ